MKRLIMILTLGVLFCMTSCFDVLEEIHIKKDGSGNYEMRFDLSGMMEMMSSFMGDADSLTEGMDMQAVLDSTMRDSWGQFATAPGVTSYSYENEGYVYTLKLGFENIDVLNETIGKEMASQLNGEDLYAISKGLFSRANVAFDLGDQDMGDEESVEMAKMMFADSKYEMIYHFPGKVKKVSNKASEILADKKTVRLECSLTDVMEETVSLGNKIKYKKK